MPRFHQEIYSAHQKKGVTKLIIVPEEPHETYNIGRTAEVQRF